jgi:hypothetical protein
VSLTDARKQLSDAVTGAGIECAPYPPDNANPSPTQAFVDTLSVDFSTGSGWSFCYSGMAEAVVVTCAQRHDKAGGTRTLEDKIPGTLQALEGIQGVRVMNVQSGTVQITGQDLPAVLYSITFAVETGAP